MTKCKEVSVASLLRGARIKFTPKGHQDEVTAVLKKKNCTTARVEFKDPTRDGRPAREDIPLTAMVASLG